MLEALTLNNTQKLLNQSPYFSARPKFTLMHNESATSTSKYNPQYSSLYGMPGLYVANLDMWLFEAPASAGQQTYRFKPENYFAGNAASVVLDSSLVMHNFIEEDSSGRVWAFVNNSSGVDGLYRRDPSITVPNWTRVIGSTNGASLSIWKKTNGDIWYHDATAGNWYLLSNGTAGSASTTPPAGLDTGFTVAGGSEAYWNYDCLAAPTPITQSSFMAPSFMLQNSSASAETAGPWAAYNAIHDNSATPSAATFHGYIPYEYFLNALFPNSGTIAGPTAVGKTFRLNSTYTLFCFKTSFSSVAYPLHPRMTFALLNRSTWTCKYLGVIEIKNATDSGGNVGVLEIAPYGARLKNGNLDVYFVGPVATLSSAYTGVGILFASIPLIKLDF